MKELSIEEKARRYDEAIKIAKRNYENIAKMDKDCTFSKEVIVYTFHHIFPELKESERIRMINFISNELACIRATDEKGSDRYDELTEAIDWLENQADQIPSNNVDPKFRVGDWITNGKLLVGQVTSFDGEYYRYMCDGLEQPLHVSNAHKWHLWTIEDANDGDVLFYHGNILLFKKINSWRNVTSYLAYSQVYGIRSHFVVANNPDAITPATKEQRDILFQKMKDAGYRWVKL